MAFYMIIILALVQGLTEFLPISSSGHLVLVHEFLGGHEQLRWSNDLMMDVAVHVGTLFSVLVYFWRDVALMARGVIDFALGRRESEGAQLGLFVVISSVPVVIAGLILHSIAPAFLRSVEVMAWATLVFGALLWWVDSRRTHARDVGDLTWRDALYIGGAQILALIPGTSRSGITMTAARWLGFSRVAAARYSLLLAIVAISGAGVLTGKDLVQSGNMLLGLDVMIAAALAFISGLVAIVVMMKWLEQSSFTAFGVYRIVMGVGLLSLIYMGVI